jgi:hypothetical protein
MSSDIFYTTSHHIYSCMYKHTGVLLVLLSMHVKLGIPLKLDMIYDKSYGTIYIPTR